MPRLPSCTPRCDGHSRGARSPVFSAFRSSRAVPATPEERLGASAEHLPEACGLRPLCRGSASSLSYEATSGFAARYGPRFRSCRIAIRQYSGSASAGHLTVSRREPRYPTAERFIGVGSFQPTRNAPLSRRTQSSVNLALPLVTFPNPPQSIDKYNAIYTNHGWTPSVNRTASGRLFVSWLLWQQRPKYLGEKRHGCLGVRSAGTKSR
jgi:hypothetical protein